LSRQAAQLSFILSLVGIIHPDDALKEEMINTFIDENLFLGRVLIGVKEKHPAPPRQGRKKGLFGLKLEDFGEILKFQETHADQNIPQPAPRPMLGMDLETLVELGGGNELGLKEQVPDSFLIDAQGAEDQNALLKEKAGTVVVSDNAQFAGRRCVIEKLKDIVELYGGYVALHGHTTFMACV
jgi:hypothetical protein